MTETLTAPAPFTEAELGALWKAVKNQKSHKFFPSIIVKESGGRLFWRSTDEAPGLDPVEASIQDIATLILKLNKRKIDSELDRFAHGCIFDTWDANLWEIARLRVRQPGVPVHVLLSGGKYSSKSEFAAWVLAQTLFQVRNREIYALTENENKSKDVQQSKLYDWLPLKYRNPRGRMATTAATKMGYTKASGFTNNEFSPETSTSVRFGFWSGPITWLDGLRPYAFFSDEGLPLEWCSMVDMQMPPRADDSRRCCKEWRELIEQKAQNRHLTFPIHRIGDLMCGVHLLTWTPSQGRTDTVDKFQNDGTVMQEIEADSDLLPRRDKDTGEILGGEILPRLIYGKDPRYITRMMYATENPMGGGGKGLKKTLIESKVSRNEILWRIYGITTRAGGSPFSNFNLQVHVRPWRLIMPIVGTWYHVVDPTASGRKCWTQLWFKVAGEQQGFVAAGDIVVCHEYPQTNDLIPGVGYPDAWAMPGGKDGKGIPGNVQQAVSSAFRDRAAEMDRVEAILGKMEGEIVDGRSIGPIDIPEGNRIMDSRVSNVVTANIGEAKTYIEWMLDVGKSFMPAGKGSSATPNAGDVGTGEQAINDKLSYDRDHCVLNEATGFMEISPLFGAGPKLWIADHCTNLIAALQNYQGVKDSFWDDFIDPLRYGVMVDPFHRAPRVRSETAGTGVY